MLGRWEKVFFGKKRCKKRKVPAGVWLEVWNYLSSMIKDNLNLLYMIREAKKAFSTGSMFSFWSESKMNSNLANTARKVSKYGVISGPYFSLFGLNMEGYGVSLRIQPEYRKIRTRNNSVFEHFSHFSRSIRQL